MKTVLYNVTGNAIDDQTITEVTRVEFERNSVTIHSAKDGIHHLPITALKSID